MIDNSKILLLNDKPALAKSLQQFLLQEFGKVDCIHDSGKARGLLSNDEYDLLVISNHLADMEGIEFIRRLRKETIDVPFVMIAGDSDIRQAVEVMKEGAVEFLQWSNDTAAFFPYVSEVLRRALYQFSKNRFVTESELLYKTLFENIRDAVYVHFVDEETRQPGPFIEVNETACRRLGYSRQEYTTMTPLDIDVPGSVDMSAIIDELFSRGSVLFKTFHVSKDGRHIPVEINSMLFNLKGRKTVLSAARNITEQQKNLDDLKNSEARFRSIIENCIIGICITDEKGHFEYVNQEYCNIYKYTPEEMLGKHFSMIAPEEHKMLLSGMHDDFIRTGRGVKGDWTVLDKYGHQKYVVGDAVRITDIRGRYRKVTFVEDITEERNVREALELSEVKYRTMMENLQDPVFISDKDFKIVYVNKAFKKRFGDVQNNVEDHKHVFGESKPCHWCMEDVENMSRFRKRVEKTINNRVYQVTTMPIEFEHVYQAKMTILRDVTKVVKARIRAEESDRLKSAFLANISHEIRTPLNAVMGFSNLLKDKDISPEETSMYVDMVNESSAHLLHVMDDIIEFSFVDSGLVKVNAQEIYTGKLLGDLHPEIERMQRKLEKENLQVTFENQLPENLVFISDKTRISQMLLNLISNALKFTEIGGVHLTVYYSDNKWVVFSVKDTGIGIPKNKHEIIFRRFRQVDEGHTRMFGGNGVGLALCKHLSQMLGGYIKLNSEPNKGSEFKLFIPAKFDKSLARALSVDFVR